MKNIIHRALALCLVLACLCAYLIPGAGALEDKATVQKALIETALAYDYKGDAVQYDSSSLTVQTRNKSGVGRMSSGASPEEASFDNTVFSVCSDYIYDIYKNALNYDIMGGPRYVLTTKLTNEMPANHPICVYKFGGEDGTKDREQALKDVRGMLQVGDIIVSYGKSSGHTLMYIGDYKGDGNEYMIHCWGGKFSGSTGEDSVEAGGAILVQELDKACFAKGAKWDLTNEKNNLVMTLLRPLQDPEMKNYSLTDAAKARLKYPGIEVDYSIDPYRYNSVPTGETITACIAITNNSKEAYKGVSVKTPVPQGASVVESSIKQDGKLTSDSIEWTVDIAAGKTVRLYFRSTVTAQRGETVVFPIGSVDTLSTREIKITVSGSELDNAKLAALKTVADKKFNFDTAAYAELSQGAWVNRFYQDVLGIDLDLPATLTDIQNNMFEKIDVIDVSKTYDGKMWQPLPAAAMTAEYKHINGMIIPDHKTGHAIHLDKDPQAVANTMRATGRILDFVEEFYEPGDVIMYYTDPDVMELRDAANAFVYLYLGDGKVACSDTKDGVVIRDFDVTIARCLKHNFLIGIRPTLGYNNINKVTAPAFSDVKPIDWFYTYVKDLVADGAVNGMTATTYVPGGNLTYGQALKLIALAVGESEQAPTGTHWASGYLALAQSKKWLSGNVNLDGQVSRLAFCEIAAAAKGLAEQPASNPFTDTDSKAVLALNKAGVINGMTATTFQPTGLLTRAQIAKIIWALGNI